MTQSNNQAEQSDAISSLLASSTYSELLEFQEPFDMFKAMRHHIGENESSAIIRFLVCDQETHQLGTQFLRSWLKEMRVELGDNCEGLPSVDFEHVTAEVEWLTSEDRRLDILICLRDGSNEPVAWIGVENKHWAREQLKQVEHYQQALVRHAHGLPSCVLFLTPSGKDPIAGKDDSSECHWLAVSYATILNAILEVESVASSEVQNFLVAFRNHLASNLNHDHMTDMNKKFKHRVNELFQDSEHRKAMLLLERFRPSGQDLLNLVKNKLGWGDDEFEFEQYPTRGNRLLESMWYPKSLVGKRDGTEISITYMFSSGQSTWDPGVELRVAVLAWCKGIEDKKVKMDILSDLTTDRPQEATWDQKKWDWECWAPIWVGPSCPLVALDEVDAEKLVKLLHNAYRDTHDWLASNMKKAGWLSEE